MKNICFIFILIVFTACSSDKYENTMSNTKQMSDQKDYAKNANVSIERKTIKTTDIRFRVKDLVESTKRIEAIAEQYDGFISGMNQSTSNHSIDNRMTLRVPVEVLEKFLAEIEQESIYTHHKRIRVQDVTEEFVDKTSRRVIQEEIEAIEGRLKYLNNQTALSTVNIDMYQKINYNPISYEKSFFTKIIDGFMDGWKLIQMTLIGLVTIWPILLIVLAVFLGRKRIRKIFGGNKIE